MGYHMSNGEEPKVCTAKTPERCKYKKGEEGVKVEHFATLSSALDRSHELLSEEYGELPEPIRSKMQKETPSTSKGRKTIRDAFSKLDADLLFEEKNLNGRVVELKAKGKTTTYTLKVMSTGKVFALYKNDNGFVRPSTHHDSIEEAEEWVNNYENNPQH